MSGIYIISNRKNGKVYVGSAKNFNDRWRRHAGDLNANRHCSSRLQNAWNKYGEDWFTFSVLEEVVDLAFLIEREQYWIDFYKAYDRRRGYNTLRLAGSSLGYRHTDETKANMSAKKRGMVSPNKGKKFSTEHRANISARKKGVYTEAMRAHIESGTRKGMKNSVEHNLRISEANKGRERTEEHRRKLSEAQKGRKQPRELVERRAASNRGKKRPESAKAKDRLRLLGSNAPWAILDEVRVIEIKKRLRDGAKGSHLAREFGVSPQTISLIKNGTRWGHLTLEEYTYE